MGTTPGHGRGGIANVETDEYTVHPHYERKLKNEWNEGRRDATKSSESEMELWYLQYPTRHKQIDGFSGQGGTKHCYH